MNAPLKAIAGSEKIDVKTDADLDALMCGIATQAREAARVLALAPAAQKNQALAAMAKAVRRSRKAILAANAEDQAEAKSAGTSPALLDRLTLNAARIEAIAAGLDVIRKLKDPIGTVMGSWRRPNGMRIERVRVPLGVIGVIYESRPNVTADAGALTLKAGNAVILRGGSDSHRSSHAIHAALAEGLRKANLPEAAISLVPTRDRAAVGMMLQGLDGDHGQAFVERSHEKNVGLLHAAGNLCAGEPAMEFHLVCDLCTGCLSPHDLAERAFADHFEIPAQVTHER